MKKVIPLFIVFALLLSCKKEKTSWNSSHLIPLVNDTLALVNIFKDNSFTSNVAGDATLSIDKEIVSLNPLELIKIPDTSVVQKFAISVNSLSVPPGFEFVNQAKEHIISINGIELKRIRVKTGLVVFRVENPVPTPTTFTVQLPGVTYNGITVSKIIQAPAKTASGPGIVESQIDLSGYYMDLTGSTGGSFNRIQSVMTVKTDPSGPSVTVTKFDSTVFKAKLINLKPDYARGYFGMQTFSDTTLVNVAGLTNVVGGTLALSQADIGFSISNGFKLPLSMRLINLSNTNNLATTVDLAGTSVNTDIDVNEASGSWSTLVSSVLNINFNQTNSNLVPFLDNLGANIKVGYKLRTNPWGNISGGWNEIFPTSIFKVRLNTNIPLTFDINNIKLRDTFAINLKGNTDKTYISEGKFILKSKNGFPLNLNLVLKALNKNGTDHIAIQPTQIIQSGLTGTLNTSLGISIANSTSEYVIPEDLLLHLEDYPKLEITATVSSGSVITTTININSFIGIQLFADFTLKTKI
jgi:hypothetical protein